MHQAGLTILTFTLLTSSTRLVLAVESVMPRQAKPWGQISGETVDAYILDKTVWLKLTAKARESKQATIPRLSAPMRLIQWVGDPEAAMKFRPEQEHWIFSWSDEPPAPAIIKVVFDRKPALPRDVPAAQPAADNSIMLHAYQARTLGEKLRFEPQSYKNTVGYWTVATDYATWKLQVREAGTYSMAVLQGCGKGQGGSDAMISLRRDGVVEGQLSFRTIDTGHFQNFRWNHLGFVDIKSGAYELRLEALRIAEMALFDVRAIHLVKQADASK